MRKFSQYLEYQHQLVIEEGKMSKWLGRAAVMGIPVGMFALPNEPQTQKYPWEKEPVIIHEPDQDKYKPYNLALPPPEFARKANSGDFKSHSRAIQLSLDIIKNFESFSAKPYSDQGGVLTIGYGFTKADLPEINPSMTMSREEADQILKRIIIQKYAPAVGRVVSGFNISDKQFASLISFAYNVGINGFINSKVVKYIKNRDFHRAAQSLQSWVYVKGKKSKGLVNRRNIEKKHFLADV